MLVVEDLWLWKAGRYEKRGIAVIDVKALVISFLYIILQTVFSQPRQNAEPEAAKVKPPGAVAQLDILGAQLTLDKVLEADATMANDGTNAIEAFRAAMQYPGT
jgi:hypothetical protein